MGRTFCDVHTLSHTGNMMAIWRSGDLAHCVVRVPGQVCGNKNGSDNLGMNRLRRRACARAAPSV